MSVDDELDEWLMGSLRYDVEDRYDFAAECARQRHCWIEEYVRSLGLMPPPDAKRLVIITGV